MRFGTVALFGRTNVGKSTFINAALGEPLAITSPLPQTTRDALLGVVTMEDAQIAFLDTPGLHRPHSELGRRMNSAALEAARQADLVIFMTDSLIAPLVDPAQPGIHRIPNEDREVLALIPAGTPVVLVLNKVDKLRQKDRLLPLMDAYGRERDFRAMIPTCLIDPTDVMRVLRELTPHLPEGAAPYDSDTLTDRPLSYFVREYVREQVLRTAQSEVPHAVAVSVDCIQERGTGMFVQATLHVEKLGQRKILVGAGGERIKAIGTEARKRIAELAGMKVHLELFVRITPRWKDIPRQLAELGYDPSSSPELGNPFAEDLSSEENAKPRRPRSATRPRNTGSRHAGDQPAAEAAEAGQPSAAKPRKPAKPGSPGKAAKPGKGGKRPWVKGRSKFKSKNSDLKAGGLKGGKRPSAGAKGSKPDVSQPKDTDRGRKPAPRRPSK